MQLLPDAGLPVLIPPPPEAKAAEPGPCAGVTRQALQDLSDNVSAARERAEANVTVNGEGVPGAEYPVAATHGRTYVVLAQDNTAQLLAQVDMYPPSAIHGAGITSAIYNWCRSIIVALHYARHWETISAVYNARRGTAAVPVECVDLINAALEVAEPVSRDATGCYIRAYTG